MEFELNEEQNLVKLMARDFAQKEISSQALKWDKEKIFPEDVIKKMAELGFMGMMIPPEYGGSGIGAIPYCLAMQEIACGDGGVAVTMSVTNLTGEPILKYGTEEQKNKYLVPLAGGEKLGAFALTEPGAGSDAGSISTRAKLEGDNYIINGTKIFITNALYADIFIVMARTGDESRGKGVSAFIVQKDFPGFALGTLEDKMGLRSSVTSELVLTDCLVPKENLLGKEGDGFKVAMSALDSGRIGIAAQSIGIARSCMEEARDHALNRKQFGKSISNFQMIQQKFADMSTGISAAHWLNMHAAWLKDKKKKMTREASMAKYFASENLNKIAYDALQIFGGYGYSKEYKIEKLYRDARVTTIYEGTSEIQQIVIARDVLK